MSAQQDHAEQHHNRLDRPPQARERLSLLAAVTWGVTLAAVGLFVAAALLPTAQSEPSVPDLSQGSFGYLLGGSLLLGAVFGSFALARHRGMKQLGVFLLVPVLLVLAVILVAFMVLGIEGYFVELLTGFPEHDSAALLVCAMVAASAVVLLVIASRLRPFDRAEWWDPAVRPPRFHVGFGRWATVVLTAVLVGGLAVPLVVTLSDAAVQSVTAPAADPAPQVTRPSGVAWSVELPADYAGVVLAAGAGVIYQTSNGVAALDGETGEQRWSYNRGAPGVAFLWDVAVGGDTVLLAYSMPSDESRLIAVNANTGVELWAKAMELDGVEPRTSTNSFVIESDSGDRWDAYDLATGVHRWHWSAPADCPGGLQRTFGPVVTFVADCLEPATADGVAARSIGFLAIDDRTGGRAWSIEFPYDVPLMPEGQPYSLSHTYYTEPAVDGTAIAVSILVDESSDVDPPGRLVDEQVVVDDSGDLIADIGAAFPSDDSAFSIPLYRLTQRWAFIGAPFVPNPLPGDLDDCIALDLTNGSIGPAPSDACQSRSYTGPGSVSDDAVLGLDPGDTRGAEVRVYEMPGGGLADTIDVDLGDPGVDERSELAQIVSAPGAVVIVPPPSGRSGRVLVGLR